MVALQRARLRDVFIEPFDRLMSIGPPAVSLTIEVEYRREIRRGGRRRREK